MSRGSEKDYHRYFIQDGRFIGRFEEMYQNVDDPWHIDELGRRLDMEAALLLLKRIETPMARTLDLGCGTGFFTHLLAEAVTGGIEACDVSATAVSKARQRYPDPRLHFFDFDISHIEELPYPENHFDLIVLAQTIWCVLPELTAILKRFDRLLTENGRLLVSQHFPPPWRQSYGREILNSAPGLIRMVQDSGFKILDTLETNRQTNHHLALLAEPGR